MLRIAQVRIVPEKGALDANHARLMAALEGIAPSRPDVVITPECFLDGYVAGEDSVTAASLLDYAIDPADSPFARDASAWAAANNAWLVLGCTRAAPEGAYNSALIFDRRGELAGTYDKTHLQEQDLKFQRGQSLPVFDSDFGAFGVMICADRRWPETVRTLALKGARVIFNPTYGMHKETNLHMMRTRSYERRPRHLQSHLWHAQRDKPPHDADAVVRERGFHRVHAPEAVAHHRPDGEDRLRGDHRSRLFGHRSRSG